MSTYTDRFAPPSRERIAEHVTGQATGTANTNDDHDGPVTRKPDAPADPLASFSRHLQARMRLLGWDQAVLQEKSGLSAHVAARAVNGSGVDLGIAVKLAALAGLDLAAMLGPYECGTCARYGGRPPKGTACLECGTEGERG